MKLKVRKFILLGFLFVTLLVVVGFVGYRGYKSVRQTKLHKQAREYLAKPDPKQAVLVLRRALGYKPDDIEAVRMMADLLEDNRSPAALTWRNRVVELNPHSLDDRLALALTATKLNDFYTATNALEAVKETDKKVSAYHNVAGTVALAVNQPGRAEAHFLEATRLAPQNPSLQLNLSAVRLRGTNIQTLAQARQKLKQISDTSTNSMLRCQALRELAYDSLRIKEFDAAFALSQRLLQESNSLFRDRLLQLDVLRVTTNSEYKGTLENFQNEAAGDTGKIYELARWQIANTSPSEALNWLSTLPTGSQTNPPIPLLMAECYTMVRDWIGLEKFIETQNWAEMEFLRRAYKSRALREQNLSGAAKGEWELAFNNAKANKRSLIMLFRLAAAWNWRSEGEELLWNIVEQYPDEKWALSALNQSLFATGRTRSLMKLYTQQLKKFPSNLIMKNNLAVTALLLDAQEFKPHDLAREVYQQAPTNSACISTYAFSQQLLGNSSEALKLMETLSSNQLAEPGLAGYYGLILKSNGNTAKAKTYLDLASNGAMLPEERKLFENSNGD